MGDIYLFTVMNMNIAKHLLYSHGIVVCVLRNNILEPVINYSEKIRGMNYFDFRPTEIVKVPPQDTMWFIEHGWAIRIPRKNENGR